MKITRTISGKYTTVIALRDTDGKYHTKRFTYKTKKEVIQAATDYQTSHLVYTTSKAFGDCMERLIDSKAKVLSPSTIRGYRGIQRTLLKDYAEFCRTPIDKITPTILQTLINDLRLSRRAKTARNYIGLISEVMTAADCRMPKLDVKKDKRMFNPDVPDAEVVKEVAATMKGTRLEAAFALACMGLRRGEICGVTADALDGDVLHVSRNIVLGDGGTIEEKSTKTEASDRYIVIPHQIAELIRSQGCAWKGTPAALSEVFPRFLRSNGFPVFRLHDCRHFFAS
ncbi:MAG: hypothetical protein Q4B15_07860, partial [Lachnospiraceae bacterium]|nr:hypothetical protein [Lachnospiraceae bacterium]